MAFGVAPLRSNRGWEVVGLEERNGERKSPSQALLFAGNFL